MKEHNHPIRVYYADTDAGGIVYHAQYITFAEKGRTEWLRELGLDHIGLREREKMIFIVESLDVIYHRPAILDDLLMVRTSLHEAKGARVALQQVIWRDDVKIASLMVRLVCASPELRPKRVPKVLMNFI